MPKEGHILFEKPDSKEQMNTSLLPDSSRCYMKTNHPTMREGTAMGQGVVLAVVARESFIKTVVLAQPDRAMHTTEKRVPGKMSSKYKSSGAGKYVSHNQQAPQ